MITLIFLLGYLAAVTGAAAYAYAHPRGIYWRSAAGVACVAAVAGLFWQLASPSNEAGLGFFFIWCALVAAAIVAGAAASIAATARYVFDAWRSAPR